VGVIIGAAFGAIVNSLVKDVVMPPISVLTGGLDFSNKFLVLRAAKDGSVGFNTPADAAKAGAITWNYGNFITLVINFLIVAGAVFLLIRAINKLRRPAEKEPDEKSCPACAMKIPIKATRCPHCTSELTQAPTQ
jgi:large conductance mechanosensitive channel